MYSYKKHDNSDEKKLKGIKKNVFKKHINHDDYKSALLNGEQLRHQMNTIRSRNHVLETLTINKTSLSCFDDKVYRLRNGIN